MQSFCEFSFSSLGSATSPKGLNSSFLELNLTLASQWVKHWPANLAVLGLNPA